MKNKLLTSSFLAVTFGLGVLPTLATSTMAPPPPPPLPGKAGAASSCTRSVLEQKLNQQRKAGNIELKASVTDIAADMAKEGDAKPLAETPATKPSPARAKPQGANPNMMSELQNKLNKKRGA